MPANWDNLGDVYSKQMMGTGNRSLISPNTLIQQLLVLKKIHLSLSVSFKVKFLHSHCSKLFFFFFGQHIICISHDILPSFVQLAHVPACEYGMPFMLERIMRPNNTIVQRTLSMWSHIVIVCHTCGIGIVNLWSHCHLTVADAQLPKGNLGSGMS